MKDIVRCLGRDVFELQERPTAGRAKLHLIVAPDLPSQLQNPEKWGRNPHVAFTVTDLDAAKNQLIAHNCPIQISASGRAAFFTQDPDGNIIELSQL